MTKPFSFIAAAAALLFVAACGAESPPLDPAQERYLQVMEKAVDALEAADDEQGAEAAADAVIGVQKEFRSMIDAFRARGGAKAAPPAPREPNARAQDVAKRFMKGIMKLAINYPKAANRVTEYAEANNKAIASKYRDQLPKD